jgi:hypothetical protein
MSWFLMFLTIAILTVAGAYIHGRACDRLWGEPPEEEEEVEYAETEVSPEPREEGPYRTPTQRALEKLPVIQPPKPSKPPQKVYCKDCEHFSWRYPATQADGICAFGPEVEDPLRGKFRRTRDPEKVNSDYDCKDFT